MNNQSHKGLTVSCPRWGLGVLLGILVSGGVSGGHLNPAVSVAVASIGKFPWWKVIIANQSKFLSLNIQKFKVLKLSGEYARTVP